MHTRSLHISWYSKQPNLNDEKRHSKLQKGLYIICVCPNVWVNSGNMGNSMVTYILLIVEQGGLSTNLQYNYEVLSSPGQFPNYAGLPSIFFGLDESLASIYLSGVNPLYTEHLSYPGCYMQPGC